MAKYKLLAGTYHDLGGVTEAVGGCTHTGIRSYKAGDIIETDMDLLKLNGREDKMRKFEKIGDPSEISSLQAEINTLKAQLAELRGEAPADEDPDDGLEAMTVAELRRHAQEEGIDLDTATRKEEIINTIRSAMEAV